MYQNTLERAVSNRGYLNRTNCPQFPLPQIEMYISRESIGSKMSKYVYPNPYSRFHYKMPLLKASNPQKELFTWARAHPPLSQQKGLHSKRILSPRALCLSPCKFVGQISKDWIELEEADES